MILNTLIDVVHEFLENFLILCKKLWKYFNVNFAVRIVLRISEAKRQYRRFLENHSA